MAELDPVNFDIPNDVRAICTRLHERGKRAWIVGGCVRDLLREQSPSDWDLATDARPEEVRAAFRRVIPTGIQHGTVTVLMNKTPYEVTTLRGEGAYQDGRRPDTVEFLDDITDDLARRDFTFNAIAIDPLNGEIIDPFDGRSDLAAKQIRAVGDPAARFSEDGLRVLRAARFAATLECTIESDTLSAMSGEAALRTFAQVSAERIHDEWLKAMTAPQPSIAFQIMAQTGMLQVCCPELFGLIACEQQASHTRDVWHHSLLVLDACPAVPLIRLAALFHDVGKPSTRMRCENERDYRFEGHAEAGAAITNTVMQRLKFSKEHRVRASQLVRHHAINYRPAWTDADVRRWMQQLDDTPITELFTLARADCTSRGDDPQSALAHLTALEGRIKAQREAGVALSTRDLAIDGKTLMQHLSLAPGPMIGKLLRALLERVTEEPMLNEQQRLLEEAQRIASAADSG